MITRDFLVKQDRWIPMDRSEETTRLPARCDGGIPIPTEPVHIENEEELDRIIDDHEIVLVEFYADWCGPCELLVPVLENIAQDTPTVVVKIDIEANRELAFAHRTRSVPTMELYKDGTQVERLVGMRSEDGLRTLIQSHHPRD